MNQPTEPNPPKRLQGVIDAAHLAYRFCDQKIGWGRIGVALSLTIIAIAVLVLFRTLRGIELRDVLQAAPIRATSCSLRFSLRSAISR
jgi:hypothetical protein